MAQLIFIALIICLKSNVHLIAHLSNKIYMYKISTNERNVVACYCALNDEVNIDEIILDAIRKGKSVVVPKVNGTIMNFHEITHMDQLEIQTFGVKS